MNATPKKLALLIDGDNAQLSYTKQIIQFCEVHGTLSIKNAYGDWKQPPLSAQVQTISEFGIKRVQQNRNVKNATDFRLAMDVASMLEKEDVDIYFIVSSDGDFTTVCEQIRQKGAKVIGIGSKSNTSSTLRKACTLFFTVEEIIENLGKPATKSSPAPQSKTPPKTAEVKKQPKLAGKSSAVPKSKTPTTGAEAKKQSVATTKSSSLPKTTPTPKILKQAFQNAIQKDGWVLIPHLRAELLKLDEHLEKRFDGKRISTWLRGFSALIVEGDRVRMK